MFDQDGVETRLECLLPDIAGYVVSPEARGADLLVQPVPNSIDDPADRRLQVPRQEVPGATKHVGILTGDVATTRHRRPTRPTEAVKSLGWKNVYNDLYPPPGPTSWTPYAQTMKDKGVKGLIWVGEPENLAKLDAGAERHRATRSTSSAPTPTTTTRSSSTSAVRPSRTRLHPQRLLPVRGGEARTRRPSSTSTRSRSTCRTARAKAYLGLQAWSAWLLFAQAAKECGNDLTRKCVYDNAQEDHRLDRRRAARRRTNPATDKRGRLLHHRSGDARTASRSADIKPNDGIFNCDPKNVYTLTGDYGKGVTLADVGKSMADLK